MAPAHPLQPAFRRAGERDDFGLAQNFDVRPCLDPVDQIARHRRSKAFRPYSMKILAAKPERKTAAWPALGRVSTRSASFFMQSSCTSRERPKSIIGWRRWSHLITYRLVG